VTGRSADDLAATLGVARLVALAMMACLVIYAVTARALGPAGIGLGVSPETTGAVRGILLATAALLAVTIPLVRRWLLAAKSRPAAGAGQRLLTTSVVTFALCQAVGVLGLVLFLLTGDAGPLYVLLVLAWMLMTLYFPRRHQWEPWAGGDG
jgi:hypothetical protein